MSRIDYSKWDKLTLSSDDDEEEPEQPPPARPTSSSCPCCGNKDAHSMVPVGSRRLYIPDPLLDGWAALPEELLLLLFNQYLCWTRAASAAVRTTCTRWNHSHDSNVPRLLIKEPWSFWQLRGMASFPACIAVKLDAGGMAGDGFGWMDQPLGIDGMPEDGMEEKGTVPQHVFTILWNAKQITSLDLNGFEQTNDALVEGVATNPHVGRPGLKHLDLAGHPGYGNQLTAAGLRLLSCFTALESINLCNVHPVSGFTDWPRTPTLTSVRLGDKGFEPAAGPPCGGPDDKGLLALCEALPHLTCLELAACGDISKACTGRALGELTHLQELALTSSLEVYDDEVSVIAGLSELRKLDLSGCVRVSSDGMAELGRLKALTDLSLANVSVSADSIRAMSSLPLVTLNLWGCHAGDSAVLALSGQTELTSLRLGFNNLTDVGMRAFAKLTKLRHLALAYNASITDEGVALLSHLLSLRHLDLQACTQLTDAILPVLNGLRRLGVLNLDQCSGVTLPAVKAFRHRRPRLRVTHKLGYA